LIRALDPDDVARCAALLDRLPQWFGLADANAAYVAALDRLPGFVDDDGAEVRGFLALERHNPRSAEILVMGVEPSCHRRGVGRALVAAAERWCVEHEVGWLHVKTRGPSTYDQYYERTRRFYFALGFEPLYESVTEWGSQNAALVCAKHLDCSASHGAVG
jgi:GNAT superfamily N-acetyltransferase